ncbi:hypothetical protein F6X40_10295 [Paraburkholderia sp. UCT31]|uniref:hypothetical protein n=1 Tax=Paraburkholderia sp. UCT31 TaxID=2615209 RepID=UPI00165671AD|nr:hypothetical protein [Paraburkholderia sp. UCT31]MBC8737198.1 hypothetical protein [Paraburkholderia sp. UCT31]
MERTLEAIKLRPDIGARLAGKVVHIFSGEHGYYWRPEAAGYTGNPKEAGQWPFEEALALSRHAGKEKRIKYRVVGSACAVDVRR